MNRITSKFLCCFSVLFLTASFSFAQELFSYKTVDTTELMMEVHYPEQMDTTEKYPALVFYFGGGWNSGSRAQFEHQAEYFAKRGLVCFLVDYRTKNEHKTSPYESISDAKSAMRYLRENSSKYHIDQDKIIASGGSAGAHLAAATALIDGYNATSDDMGFSSIPNALILFNPVIDNGPGGYGYERIGDQYKDFSPLHNIKAGAPPTLFLLGTKDNLVPVVTAQYYQMVMEKVGNRCDLILYEDQPHGFFNYTNFEYYKKTVQAADDFLQSLGYLEKEPVVIIE
ncbi:alpha/beta hydrolase [Algoriphagus chordae]|uniref:Dienelactone hydrolase family protein n=1 Tax=Algoriphagus chordae TaxID=237019 RepID=A0A2W7RK85_9BACT|nr:alpha/beta hydrolase [Algoriphagus chordae]PZX54929.1 dienelactone hydrolase family protein [Algoriphagus chordae]